MLATIRARQTHQKLMRAANHVLREALHSLTRSPDDVTPAELVAYAFGRYRLDLTHEDAQRYLDAVRVARGDTLASTQA
ncbi:hypothetical protein ACTWJ8_40235 (plasmid) [Streptomyces sp. SDT5-1]|uniref:hypothetical protein n=1 Tax=Streptomyces sp. SDT5-1 TaxID=3406418 RepID=UPI003FD6346B